MMTEVVLLGFPQGKSKANLLTFLRDELDLEAYQDLCEVASTLKDYKMPKLEGPQTQTAVQKVCSMCKTKLTTEAHFCSKCGGAAKAGTNGEDDGGGGGEGGGGGASDATDLNGLRSRHQEIDDALAELKDLSNEFAVERVSQVADATEPANEAEDEMMEDKLEDLFDLGSKLDRLGLGIRTLERKYRELYAHLAHAPKKKNDSTVYLPLGAVADLSRKLTDRPAPKDRDDCDDREGETFIGESFASSASSVCRKDKLPHAATCPTIDKEGAAAEVSQVALRSVKISTPEEEQTHLETAKALFVDCGGNLEALAAKAGLSSFKLRQLNPTNADRFAKGFLAGMYHS